MTLWRIYYGDGTTFSSTDGSVHEAPPYNVVAVVQPDPDTGRAVIHRFGWYWHNGEEWFGSDIYGVLDNFMHDTTGRSGALKQGRVLPNAIYDAVLAQALADPDFPPKSARRPNETP